MGLAVSLAGTAFSIYSQNRALEAQGRANAETARSMVQSMNYQLQNLEQARRDTFEATIAELEKVQLQGKRLTSYVNAAVHEGLMGGGRTAALLKRSGEADIQRTRASIKDNYQKKSNEIDQNKEAALLNARAQIRSIHDVEKPSLLGTALQFGTAYIGAKQQQDQINMLRLNAGTGKEKGDAAQPFSFNSLLGDIDHKQQKFTFDVPNPFSQAKQTVNYF